VFSFKPLSGGQFGRAVCNRVLILLGVNFALRFLAPAVGPLAICSTTSISCKALLMAIAVPLYSKWFIVLLFALSFLNITVGRLRDAGLPWILAGVVPVLLFADLRFGIAFLGPWKSEMTYALSGDSARFLIAGFSCLAALCVMGKRGEPAQAWRARFGGLARLASGTMMALALAGVVGLLLLAALVYPSFLAAMLRSKFLFLVWPGLLAASLAPLLLAPIAVREWRQAGSVGQADGWFPVVVIGAAILVVTSAANTVHLVLGWIDPALAKALADNSPVPWGLLNYAAFLAALTAPMIIGKMIEKGPSGSGSIGSRPTPPPGSQPTWPVRTASRAAFGRRDRT
jgi:uncharacterized membrane protein YhaH (DUF805 family)